MEAAMNTQRRAADRPLDQPHKGGSVWPGQCCPAFTPRAMALATDRECWYCRYADFHLKERVALDVGICCWPRVQIE